MYMEWGCEAINIALERSKIEMNSRLEVSWALGALLRANGSIWWKILAKIGEAWAKLAASCDQDGPRYL